MNEVVIYFVDHYDEKTMECFSGIFFRTFKPIQILPECESLVEAVIDEEGTEALVCALWSLLRDPRFQQVGKEIMDQIKKHEAVLHKEGGD